MVRVDFNVLVRNLLLFKDNPRPLDESAMFQVDQLDILKKVIAEALAHGQNHPL